MTPLFTFTRQDPRGPHSNIVCSVPHSGTRSLLEHLGQDYQADRQGHPGGKWWHFGSSYEYLRRNPAAVTLHVPIRNPRDVAKSWAQRNAPLENLLVAYGHMFEVLGRRSEWPDPKFELYRMEDMPRTAGTNEHPTAPDESPKIELYRERVWKLIALPYEPFFTQFYTEWGMRP